jgi:hypothetical protein
MSLGSGQRRVNQYLLSPSKRFRRSFWSSQAAENDARAGILQASSILQAHRMRQIHAILIGLQARSANTVRGERFVLLLRVAGDANGAEQRTVGGTDSA